VSQERFEISAPLDKRIIAFLVILLVLIISFSTLVFVYTEYLWFNSLKLGDYFLKILYYRVELFGIFFVISLTIFLLNRLALHMASEEFLGEPLKVPVWIFLVLSLFFPYVLSRNWVDLVFFLNGQEFGVKDPIFGIDISFYAFKLPFIKDLINIFFVLIVFCLIISIIYYFLIFRWVKSFEEFKDLFPRAGFIHISALIASIMILAGVYLYIGRYDLLSSQIGVVKGAGYTDVFIRMPAMLILSIASFALAAVSIYYGLKRQAEMYALVFFVLIALVFIGLVLIPVAFQKIRVDPNELSLEERFIGYSINYTRIAYGLDVKKKVYPVKGTLTIESIEKNSGIIENIRLWDHRPLLSVYRQIQQIRTYYYINDVDVDRYYIDGNYTQLMISARELSPDLLPPTAQTWVNRHLIYTHGYGVIASPVNAVSEEGRPELFVYDIPPKGVIKVERPEIYYGEITRDYVIVKTLQKEFDYPFGEKNVFSTYNGTGGVLIDNFLKKLLFGMRFGDVNLLLTGYLTPESKIMMHRQIMERVYTLAPYLSYDRDPYIAIIDGKLYWIVDAYTTLDNFPYSAAVVYGKPFNYIRNSVKIFVDAYNGSMKFYVMSDEPVIKTLTKAFPELFVPFEEMGPEEKSHIRYPIDLFKIQAEIYSIYHMDDPRTFYNKEDVWEIPTELFEEQIIDIEPYYVIITIAENKPEFLLMLPFSPKGRDNIISWMAARCDENYGEILLYEFPKGTLVYGPMQIEARIDQDPEISKIFTLWSQAGSRIIRGNLLVIPIDNSIIYVEPVYLRAENAQIPELRGVVVSYENRLVMKPDLQSSIGYVFGEAKAPERPVVEDLNSLTRLGIELYEKALEEIKKGNWSGFGEMLERLGEVLRKINSTVSKGQS
jgi:hypothetical protein